MFTDLMELTQVFGAAEIAELEDPTVRIKQQILGFYVPKRNYKKIKLNNDNFF
jgi:hypothetical protein